MNRHPTPSDVSALAAALNEAGVEYVLIGGAAMALHGYPRMTKDIDLLLPVDPENNRRLLAALSKVPDSAGALAALRPSALDEGYSTSFSGAIEIDLLYVAADRVFGELRRHIRTVEFDGASISTLDVEGLLATKQTTREEDIPDRLKLERLRNALYDAERERRISALRLPLQHPTPAERIFVEMALAAIKSSDKTPDWRALEYAFIARAVADLALPADAAAQALCRLSPGAVYPTRQDEIEHEAQVARAPHSVGRPRRRSTSPRTKD